MGHRSKPGVPYTSQRSVPATPVNSRIPQEESSLTQTNPLAGISSQKMAGLSEEEWDSLFQMAIEHHFKQEGIGVKFNFFVPGLCQAKQYQQSKSGVVYNKGRVRTWEKTVAWAATAAAGPGYKPLFGPVTLWLDFYMPIPKSRKELKPGMPHLQDSDTTNLQKSCEDGLKKVLFMDDNLVWKITSSKVWCEAGKEGVGVMVEIDA
jgi:Holliday junction resolvase RusA-like endonuclease